MKQQRGVGLGEIDTRHLGWERTDTRQLTCLCWFVLRLPYSGGSVPVWGEALQGAV
jgi:hypothetical protein